MTKTLDQFLNESAKPERTEHSWPTRRNKKTGGWYWANSHTGGHENSDAADRHAIAMNHKMKNTSVPLDMLKPGDKPLTNPVGLGGRKRGTPRWAK